MTEHLRIDSRLEPLVDAEEIDDRLREIAKEMAAEHGRLTVPAAAPVTGSGDAWRSRMRASQAAIERLGAAGGDPTASAALAEALREVNWLTEQYTHHRNALFTSRWHEGAIVEQVPSPNEAAWAQDVLVEVAAFACDVELVFGPRAAHRVIAWYQEFSNEHHPSSLAHFFMAHRALQHCLTPGTDVDDMSELVTIARQHLESARPRLVLVGGGPGTGKSTLAEAVAEVVGWPVLSSHEIRRELSAEGNWERADASEDYQPDRTDAVYARLLERAEALLHLGEPVIVDASWSYERHRAAARDTALGASATVVEIECALEASIARERLAWEQASPFDSAADEPELVDVMAAQRGAWSQATTIDTALPLLRCRSDALKAILGFPPVAPQEIRTDSSPGE